MSEHMDLRDEDRLPWLETVEPDEESRGGVGRTVAGVLLGLALVAAVVFGVYSWRHRAPDADGALIAAQQGSYKVRPDDPGGLKVEGEGDAAVATSAGKGASNGAVDLRAVPEAPVTPAAPVAAKSTQPGRRTAVAAVPAAGGRLVAAAPVNAGPARAPGVVGGSLVQLGAFPSEAAANAAWGGFAKRFGYLAALGKSVQPVEVNGHTFYRLKVNAGSNTQAADIVARLRVAGEDSFVTN